MLKSRIAIVSIRSAKRCVTIRSLHSPSRLLLDAPRHTLVAVARMRVNVHRFPIDRDQKFSKSKVRFLRRLMCKYADHPKCNS